MAERRMFAKSIVLSDAFLDMPLSARCLYFTLGVVSDDDGFVGNPKAIMRQCGASQDDMSVLLAKRYVLGFESGVIVIKHWRINNYLREDRHKSTTYIEELATLTIDEKGAYTEKNKVGIPVANQVREVGTPSIGKDSIGKNNNTMSGNPDDVTEVIDYLNEVLGTRYTKCKSTVDKIKARLKEGHTVDDFKTVIDKKHAEWGDDAKMSKYLRPETLFNASHFESYLNEPIKPAKTVNAKIHNYDERDYDFDELSKIAGIGGNT